MDETTKLRIREEEIFRDEVRHSLKPQENRIWKVLNSPFCLFLLGSVLLTGLTTLYQKIQLQQSEASEMNSLVSAMENEIGFRLNQIRNNVAEPEPTAGTGYTYADRQASFGSANMQPLTKRFDGITMSSIVYQYKQLKGAKKKSMKPLEVLLKDLGTHDRLNPSRKDVGPNSPLLRKIDAVIVSWGNAE